MQGQRVGGRILFEGFAYCGRFCQSTDCEGQLFQRIAFGLQAAQEPGIAACQPPFAQSMEETGAGDGGFSAAGRAGDDDEVCIIDTLQQVVDEAFTAEKELGVVFVEGGQAEVGDTAVPHLGLVFILELHKEIGYFRGGEALVNGRGYCAAADGDRAAGDLIDLRRGVRWGGFLVRFIFRFAAHRISSRVAGDSSKY